MTQTKSQPGTLLLIGGTSDIGRACALCFAQAGWRILMTARNLDEARRNADDITARTGAEVSVHHLDILDSGLFERVLDTLPCLPDIAVCVVGELGDQARGQTDQDHATLILRTNFEGPALLLGLIAERFLARGMGILVGVSSVAGERGRASNYLYGSAKAGFTAFLSGLRGRLSARGVRVITVKPGFVRTRMTADLTLPPIVTAEPDEVGRAIFRAALGGGGDVIYVRRIWQAIMLMVKCLPEGLFKRLKM